MSKIDPTLAILIREFGHSLPEHLDTDVKLLEFMKLVRPSELDSLRTIADEINQTTNHTALRERIFADLKEHLEWLKQTAREPVEKGRVIGYIECIETLQKAIRYEFVKHTNSPVSIDSPEQTIQTVAATDFEDRLVEALRGCNDELCARGIIDITAITLIAEADKRGNKP